MLFDGTIANLIANPEQLAAMEEAFDSHCLAHNIMDEGAREFIAQFIVMMLRAAHRPSRNLG